MNDGIEIDKSFGGEIEEFLNSIKDKPLKCICGEKLVADEFIGCTHTGGLADSEGVKWWVYKRCHKCNYDISFNKIENRIIKLELDEDE